MGKDDEAVIKLRAEVGNLKKDLGKANKQIKGFKDKATKSFEGLGKSIAQVFGVAMIAKFITTGIKDFAEMERSLANLGRKVEQTGTSWADASKEVKAYIASVQEATRFGDDQALASIDRLVSLTGDYTVALQLNERAMDLAVFAGLDLSRASEIVALSYQSNTEGLTALGKELGLTTEESKDATEMFALLDKKSQGLARSEVTMATAMTQAKNAMADVGKLIGEKLAPTVLLLTNIFAKQLPRAIGDLVKAMETMGLFFGMIFGRIMILIDQMTDGFRNLGKFLKNVWKGPGKAFKEFQAQALADLKKHDVAVRYLNSEYAADTMKIWRETADGKADIDLESLQGAIKVSKEMTKLGKSEIEFYREKAKVQVTVMKALTTKLSDEAVTYTKQAFETIEEFTQRVAEQEALISARMDATFAKIQEFSAGLTAAFAENFALWGEQMVEGTFNVGKAFERLAKSMLKFMLQTIGQGLLAEAASMLAKSIAFALGIVTAGAAPGLAAGAAKMAAAGGLIMGLAGAIKLAAGGLVTQPTNAIIGEAGPEAVIPLDKFEAMMGGGIDLRGSTFAMAFPNVRNEEDLNGGRFLKTAGNQFARSIQNHNQRSGQKTRRAI